MWLLISYMHELYSVSIQYIVYIQHSNTHVQPVGNVDEEGYSIRPEDAASISYFPDEVRAKKDESESDSDFGDGERMCCI